MTEVWVFDLDGCIIDSLSGSSLRPGTVELLDELRRDGHTRVLWSAGGAEYAKHRAATHDILDRFDAFHDKDGRDLAGRYVTDHFLVDHGRVVFVDDRPEDMPEGANVIAVSPYLAPNPHDRAFHSILEAIAHRNGALSPRVRDDR